VLAREAVDLVEQHIAALHLLGGRLRADLREGLAQRLGLRALGELTELAALPHGVRRLGIAPGRRVVLNPELARRERPRLAGDEAIDGDAAPFRDGDRRIAELE